jgi:hypothetical protein
MPLFKSQQIPRTSYGYQPPPGSTAHGWACTVYECGRSDHQVVKRWPFACVGCGGPTDPLFNEPWAHEARGVELQYILTHYPDRDGGFSEKQWPIWQYTDATLHNDSEGAARARASARSLDAKLSQDSWWIPGDLYYQLVWAELAANHIDGAAEDLVHWLSLSVPDDVENNNSNRTNCRQVVDMVIRFFANPGTEEHPLAPQIRTACLDIGAAAFPVLNNELQAGINRLARS